MFTVAERWLVAIVTGALEAVDTIDTLSLDARWTQTLVNIIYKTLLNVLKPNFMVCKKYLEILLKKKFMVCKKFMLTSKIWFMVCKILKNAFYKCSGVYKKWICFLKGFYFFNFKYFSMF